MLRSDFLRAALLRSVAHSSEEIRVDGRRLAQE